MKERERRGNKLIINNTDSQLIILKRMNSNTSDQQDRIDELINQFERQLTDFIRSKDLEKKGLLLGELYCSNSEIKELLKEQTSIVSKRKI